MAALAKGVALTFGLLTTSVSVTSAIEKVKSGNRNVCVGYGQDEDGKPRVHDVALIHQPTTCPTCGVIPYEAIKKAQPVGDGFVLLEASEIAEASTEAVAFKKRADLTPHAAEAVESATVAGEKLYHLTPDAGHEPTYALLAQFIGTHAELAFMGQWTPRSVAGQFRVVVREGVLCFQERVRAENVRATPVLTLPPVLPAYLAMVEQVLAMPGIVTEYDPTTYADKYTEKIAALVASKDVVPAQVVLDMPGAAAAPMVASGDPMAALQAMLATVTPITDAPSAPAPKKATTKKAASKKGVA